MTHDLLVLGAGPAGLCAAIAAAQRGWDVVVADPQEGTIDKACGEGLMPGAVEALQALGVTPHTWHPFEGIRYVHAGRVAEGRFPHGVGWGVRRLVLHEALQRRADALGVRRVVARAADLVQHADHVEAAGLRARWVIAADGLRSPVRRHLGLDRPTRWPRRYGIRQHFFTPPWSPFVEVHWTDEVEAYITPVSADTVGVALLFDDRARGPTPMDRLLERFPDLRARLGAPASHPRGAGPFAHGAARRVEGRVLLVGDAAGYLDPLTGEGVRLGVAGAVAAVDAIAHDQPEAYEAAWRALWRPYALTTGALLVLTRPRLIRRMLVPALQRLPGLFDRILAQLAS
jgi:flavin-dependent dehydrogenase